MKKNLLPVMLLMGCSVTANAADLMQVFNDALFNDPIYQQALAERLADKENVPINRAPLLPQANINGGPSLTRFNQSAAAGMPDYSTTSHGYSVTLTVTQTVFNYAQFKALAGASALSKQADASLNAAEQELMVRVAGAYFGVLKAQENLAYSRTNKKSFREQYTQTTQQYKIGSKTLTDIYTARSSYDTAVAGYIAAETALAGANENLRVITGKLYATLGHLNQGFPLISVQPAVMETWVHTAQLQNWNIKANEYATQVARETIKQQSAAHLPTVNLQGAYNLGYNNNQSDSTGVATTLQNTPFIAPNKAHTRDATISLNVGIPIFGGGAVVAQTNQARYRYQIALQKLESAIRSTVSMTRQSFLGIQLGIQQLKADRQAIQSNLIALQSLRARYNIGSQTLVDVVNQQQKVFLAQTQYAADRYAYINNLLLLKQAAGILSVQDLQALNGWLSDRE